MMNGDMMKDNEVLDSLREKYLGLALLWISDVFDDSLKNRLNNYYYKFRKQAFCVVVQFRTENICSIREMKRYKRSWVMIDEPNRNYLKVLDCPAGKVRFMFKNRIFNTIDMITNRIRKINNDEAVNELRRKHHFIIEAMGNPDSLTIGYLYLCKNYTKHNHICSFASVENIKDMYMLCLKISKCSCNFPNKYHALISIKNKKYLNSLYKKQPGNTFIKKNDKQTTFININTDNYKKLLEDMNKIIIVFGEKNCRKNHFLSSISKHFGDKEFPLHNCPKKTDYLYYIKQNVSKIALIKIYYNYQNGSSQKFEDCITKFRKFCDLCSDNVTIVFIQKSISCHERLNNAIQILSKKYEIVRFNVGEEDFENYKFDNSFTVTQNFRVNKYLSYYEDIDENIRKTFGFLEDNRKNNEEIVKMLLDTILPLGDKGINIENYSK
ncbi:hypothetical protein SteCoe_31011 [Stentor coeruleus]|uniref:Uncharacterized protein n=1 Tax=Stentor coeruleus TaxID=5963 RepID=A0A1R2B2C0_9CILI|nr:hypothetical protein SteCoe_31011 [Stentor coeruleus]